MEKEAFPDVECFHSRNALACVVFEDSRCCYADILGKELGEGNVERGKALSAVPERVEVALAHCKPQLDHFVCGVVQVVAEEL